MPNIRWASHLKTGEERAEMNRLVENSTVLLDRLKDLITEKVEVYQKKAISKESYASPNWALEQADNAGYRRALQEILELVDRKGNHA